MYIVVVGAGQLGYYLTKDLLRKKQEVTLIDWDLNRVQLLDQDLGGVILHASGSSIDGLEKAGCSRADVIVAATGHDEDNLIICQLGKRYFKVPKAIARINNPKNEHVFRELGVGTTISGTKAIADSIEAYMLKKQYKTLLTLNNGEAEMIEVEIIEGSPSIGKKTAEVKLPKNCLIALTLRGKEVVYTDEDTQILAEDIILAITSTKNKEELRELLQGTGE